MVGCKASLPISRSVDARRVSVPVRLPDLLLNAGSYAFALDGAGSGDEPVDRDAALSTGYERIAAENWIFFPATGLRSCLEGIGA